MNERILVVDDTPANIQTVAAILKGKGYQLSVATNGKQALDALTKIRPDLILLDVMMPELDGFETCQRIKSSEDRKSTRLNSSHRCISYAVFCLKKKKTESPNAVIASTTRAAIPVTTTHEQIS